MWDVDAEVEVREVVYASWRELLAIDPAAFDADRGFVASGGYSLLGLRLIDVLSQRLGVKLELSEFLGDLSANALAARIVRARNAASAPGLDPTDSAQWEEGFI